MNEASTGKETQPFSETAERSAVLLEHLARREGIPFDRLVMRRTLHDAIRNFPGSDRQIWTQRLVECAESFDLRLEAIDCTLNEVTDLVSCGHLVTAERILPGGEIAWILIDGFQNGKLNLFDTETGKQSWLSPRKFARRLGLATATSKSRFIYGHRVLMSGSAANDDASGSAAGGAGQAATRRAMGGDSTAHSTEAHPSPFRRLMAMLRAERGDIWVVVIFSLIVGCLMLTTPIAVESLVNTVAFGKYLQPVLILALMVFALLSFSAAITIAVAVVVEILQRRFFVRVVEDLAYRLPRVQQQSVDGLYLPESANRFFDVMHIQKSMPKLLVEALEAILQTLVGMTVLAFYHPFLLGFDLILLFLMALAIFVFGRGATRTAIAESYRKYDTANWLEEIARHPTAFRLNGGAQFAFERADQLAIAYLDERKAHFRIVIRQYSIILGIYVVASTALLGLGGWLVISGELTLGQLVASELIVTLIMGSAVKLAKKMETYYDLLASVDKIGHLLDLPIEPHSQSFQATSTGAAELCVNSVACSLNGNATLSGLSLKISRGSSLGLCLQDGNQLRALADLVVGLRHAEAGSVQLDGMDLRQMRPDAIQERVGIARDIEVFAGTIEENVHLGRTAASAQTVREALKSAGLEQLLASLPLGSRTFVLTDGSPLASSVLRQLMLARAIAGSPGLLVIDRTLDPFPEVQAKDILDRLRHSRQLSILLLTSRPELAVLCENYQGFENNNLGVA